MAGREYSPPGNSQSRSLQLSDNERKNNVDTREFKSRIPRPVYSSVESAVALDVKRLQGGAEVMAFHENDGGFINPAYESINSSSEVRTARYHGKYSSYEEMLANMDDQDPFRGQPTHEENGKKLDDRSEPHGQQKRVGAKRSNTPSHHRKKKKQVSSPPGYDDAHNGRQERVDTLHKNCHDYPESEIKRRLSNVSTGTFTVQKGDSCTNLINRTSDENAITAAMQTILNKHQIEDLDDQDCEKVVASFIEKNEIKMRQCNTYIRVSTENDNKQNSSCCCGRDKNWHIKNQVPEGKPKQKWSVDENTETLPTTCFGTICFQGFGQEAPKAAPYIRIDKDTKPDVILSLLNEYWKMPEPKLIISVTGGAKRFFLKNRLKNSFKRGLVNVAMTTGAWIVTGGTNTGVMEFVGEAVKEYTLSSGISEQRLVVLGITTWGVIDNKENLTPSDEMEKPKGLFPAYYNHKDLYTSQQKGISPLDHNHTHFILVDDGREKKFGAEIPFRAALENSISKLKTEMAHDQKDAVPIPVVLLVLEGGENTIKTALEAVQNNIPVVIIQGSGRAADVIAFAVKYFKLIQNSDKPVNNFTPAKIDSKPVDEVHYTKIKEKVEDWLDWSPEEKSVEQKKKKVFECVKNIERMLKKRALLTVFFLDDIDTTNEIDQAILHSLLKARQSNILDQLNLALVWNHCNIARQEIFSNENRQHWRGKIEELYKAMFIAMIQNRLDFVQLFLDNGVELKEFLTVKRLRELYDEIINNKYSGTCASLLQHLLQREQSKWQVCCCRQEEWSDDLPNLLSLVGKLISNLAGDQYASHYQDSKYVVDEQDTEKNPDWNEKLATGDRLHSVTNRRYSGGKQESDFVNPEKDLMFWAVLLNRKDMAHLFWKLGKDHIGGALTASIIFKNLSRAANEEEELDLSNELLMNSEEFEELATGVLNECYQRDKNKSHKLLVRSLDLWGDTTVMSIADSGEQMTLMGHSCCQTKLNKIWKGKMALYTSMWKIILGLLFFPFIIPTIRFTTKDSHDLLDLVNLSEKSHSNQVLPSDDRMLDGGSSRRREKMKKLYSVGQGCNSGDEVNFWQAMYLFHTAPLVKFCYHTLAYVCFLGLFCFFLLTNLRHPLDGGPSTVEFVVWCWAATMLFEEFRQIASRDPNSIRGKLSSYFSSTWNRFDMTVYFLLIVTVILRFELPYQYFVWARRLYAITLTMLFLRFMQTYYVEKNMGPKVIMIKKMLTDLVFFVLILAVFVFGYGVSVQALRYPNAELSWNILKNVVYMPYWNIYGELFLEDLESDTTPSCPVPDPSNPSCPKESWLVMILLALYMVFTNVLLLNLLIAMFSYTFERVQQNSEKVWRFHRYGLIYEFFDKPTLAPPLIVLTHAFRLFKFLLSRCSMATDDSQKKESSEKRNNDFYQKLPAKENDMLTAFERVGMENYLIYQNLIKQEHIQNKVSNTGERIEKVIADLEQIKETVASNDMTKSVENLEETADLTTVRLMSATYHENSSILQNHLQSLQEQVEKQRHQMQMMFSMMSNVSDTLTTLAQSHQQISPVEASTFQRDSNMSRISHPEPRPFHDEIITPTVVSIQRSPSYSKRVRREPQPQIEIQEFPPGYTDT